MNTFTPLATGLYSAMTFDTIWGSLFMLAIPHPLNCESPRAYSNTFVSLNNLTLSFAFMWSNFAQYFGNIILSQALVISLKTD
jgi:hypothetical protein